jgi:transcriptional antiterminator RfaH
MMDAHWYAVYTHVQKEWIARDHLDRQGYVSYLPVYRKVIRHARNVREVERPLFPRYLFVRVSLEGRAHHPIRSTIGVNGIVCHGDVPIPVPEGVIDSLKSNEDSEGVIALGNAMAFNKGDRVRITSGQFEGVEALFMEMKDADRVVLLLGMMHSSWRVVVKTAEVERT